MNLFSFPFLFLLTISKIGITFDLYTLTGAKTMKYDFLPSRPPIVKDDSETTKEYLISHFKSFLVALGLIIFGFGLFQLAILVLCAIF